MSTSDQGDGPADLGPGKLGPFDEGPTDFTTGKGSGRFPRRDAPPPLDGSFKPTVATRSATGGPKGGPRCKSNAAQRRRRRHGWSWPAISAVVGGVVVVVAIGIVAAVLGNGDGDSETVVAQTEAPPTTSTPQQPAPTTTTAPAPTTTAAPTTTTTAPLPATGGIDVQQVTDKTREGIAEIVSDFGAGYVGVGSGFFISSDGNIVTNEHVINGLSRLFVRLHNDEIRSAILLGADISRDLAVLDIAGSGHKPLKLGQDSGVEFGQEIVVIGFPLGLGLSVTDGVVSSPDQMGPLGGSCLVRLIQTNAAINRGNSGGPLLNSNGDVIGINTIKFVAEDIEGVGFAIDVKAARRAISALQGGARLPDPGFDREC